MGVNVFIVSTESEHYVMNFITCSIFPSVWRNHFHFSHSADIWVVPCKWLCWLLKIIS